MVMNPKLDYYFSLSCIIICVLIVLTFNIILFKDKLIVINDIPYDLVIKNADNIYFDNGVVELLNINYMLFDTEFLFCVNGTVNDTGVYVDSLKNGGLSRTNKEMTMYNVKRCRNTLGTIHSHPSGELYGDSSCRHSKTDIKGAKGEEKYRVLDCVICGKNKISCLFGDDMNTYTVNYVKFY